MLKTYHFMIIYALQCIYIYYIWIVEILYSGVLLYFFSQLWVHWLHIDSIKLVMVGVFIALKSSNLQISVCFIVLLMI